MTYCPAAKCPPRVSLMSLTKLLTEGLCCEGKGKAMRVYNHSMTLFNFTMQENLLQTPIPIIGASAQALSYSYNVQEKEENVALTWHR